jgi:16S rRNA (adenine1518-N6/adenine1519-N6)-dimethyltransferase
MTNRLSTNKSLGQHWLKDRNILRSIADYADLSPNDTVLEIGPGLGSLTKVLARRASRVVAVEFDQRLAEDLTLMAANFVRKVHQEPANTTFGHQIEIVNADFLQFDLSKLPPGYKVVANIPYYITNKIIMKLLASANQPATIVLLVQKEVAQRLAAQPGNMSVLAVAAQLYADVELGLIVPSIKFSPPPKVDSQIVILRPLPENRQKVQTVKQLMPVVKAGFSARRKKLRSSLAGGLGITKSAVEEILRLSDINPNCRAQDLSLDDWRRLAKNLNPITAQN